MDCLCEFIYTLPKEYQEKKNVLVEVWDGMEWNGMLCEAYYSLNNCLLVALCVKCVQLGVMDKKTYMDIPCCYVKV